MKHLADEIYKQVVDQLRQDHYELTTLLPRLTPMYAKSVEQTRKNIEGALEALGEKL